MNLPYPKNDTAETEVKASGPFATSYAFTSAIAVKGYNDIDLELDVTDKTGISTITVKAQWTTKASPSSDADWTDLTSDDSISNGAVTLATYEASKSVASLTAPFRDAGFNFPRRGLQMRFGIKANAAGGAYSAKATRNVR